MRRKDTLLAALALVVAVSSTPVKAQTDRVFEHDLWVPKGMLDPVPTHVMNREQFAFVRKLFKWPAWVGAYAVVTPEGCTIYLQTHTLSAFAHELRHCQDPGFHKDHNPFAPDWVPPESKED